MSKKNRPGDPQPKLPSETELERRLSEALARYHDLAAQESPVDLQEFCSLYPDLEPELRLQLETLVEIDKILDPETAAAEAADQGFEKPGVTELPRRLSGYRILEEIGSGGMGRVLLAFDDRLGRKLAIKTLAPNFRENPTIRARFMNEARAVAQLNHPRIVQIYNLGKEDEEPHFVMEYLEGRPITEAARFLPIRQRAELMHKVVAAVGFLHQNNFLHRDLKPANILVGADLEPKLLDFGLALPVENRDRGRITRPGQVLGTPDYFSPEQARGEELDPRSDVFSLGTLFYELLTGGFPFPGETLERRIQSICEKDPRLPRRINVSIPGDLQKICLKALEKDPAHRYDSAADFGADLERYLAEEPVLAAPTTYTRLVAGKIEQHLQELRGWKEDQILTAAEFDAFRKLYDRLVESEDSWIMEMRRFSLPQVSLYLGAWILVVGAALILLFLYPELSGTPAVLVVSAATLPALGIGIRTWRKGEVRASIAYLLAFCLLLPVSLLVSMHEWQWFTHLTRGDPDLEFFSLFPAFRLTTNAQMWWALVLSLPLYVWLRRLTHASVFTLVFAVALAHLCLVTLLRMGLLDWLENDPGRPYFRLIPFAILFLAAGMLLERLSLPRDSRYFYPFAVVFTLVAFSGVALFHEPYPQWLERNLPVTRGQVEYLFVINALLYLLIQFGCDRVSSPQMRQVAKSFRFVIPGHILVSLFLLGVAAFDRWQEQLSDGSLRFEARFFEVLLPAVASLFVFGSIPKQMKNFLATGLLFLGIGLIRLQQDLFKDEVWWPLLLLAGGFGMMLAAANYAYLRVGLRRALRRLRL